MQFTKISRPQFLHLSSILFLKQLYKNAPSIHSFKRTSKLTSASVQPSSQKATAYASLSPFQQPFSRWTWVSWCLLKLKVMEVVVTTGAIGRAKLQSNHHHQQTNIQFFTSRMPFLSPNQVSKHWREISHSMDLLTPSSPGGLPTLSLTTNSSWLPCGRVAMPLISPLMPVPHNCPCIRFKIFSILFALETEPLLEWLVNQKHSKTANTCQASSR